MTIEAVAGDLAFFLFEKCLFTNTITLYCTRQLKKRMEFSGVTAEYGGSYSVVCVINIPA